MKRFLNGISLKKGTVVLAACLALDLCACGKAAPEKEASAKSEEVTKKEAIYAVGVMSGTGGDRGAALQEGFAAALNDVLGEGVCDVETRATLGDPAAESQAASAFRAEKRNLIFAVGGSALSTASVTCPEIPVVGAGIIDYPAVLGLSASADWDGYTGKNVTGVSSLPPMADELSLLIEAVPNLSSVALLTAEGDTNGRAQLDILEGFLEQAAIGYKEYQIPLTPPDPAAEAAAKAAGTALPTAESQTALAATECSCLFLPAESALTPLATTIAGIAKTMRKPLIGGDETVGREALVCGYQDPFDEGYRAGQIAAKILNDGTAARDIAVRPAASPLHKLYNGAYAKTLGMTFPKSFTEYEAFFETFAPGSDTTRVKEE